MSTVNFSVPEDVKRAFHAAFAGQNKSAVITALMREAVERRAREARHQAAVEAILAEHTSSAAALPRVTEAQFREAREHGRP
jgi:hypothetical protein